MVVMTTRQGKRPTEVDSGCGGLLGLRDRAAAVNGTLWFASPPGEGTRVAPALPIAAAQAA
jgi:signal transduction histidine kinase